MWDRTKRLDVFLLIAVALASLVLDRSSDRLLELALGASLPWIRALHLLPLVVAIALYVACGPGSSWRLPRDDVKHGWLVVPIWAACFAFVLGLRVLIEKEISRSEIVIGTVDFMITHIIAQELLFRGALVALAGRLWPPDAKQDGDASLVTLLVVSLVFGLAQLQYQESLLHSAPWWQVFRAFLVGLVMGVFRSSLRSVWASGCFHAFNNLIAAAR